MALRGTSFAAIAKFNSTTSSKLLSVLESHTIELLQQKNREPKSKTFAPSSFRCDRKCWFRLRGTQPDYIQQPDLTLNYMASIGTARHEAIQTNLMHALGEDWITVPDYLDRYPIDYDYELSIAGLETRIEIFDPPIRFACDGIVRIDGNYYLLEIKTTEFSAWEELVEPKPIHMDQIKCYSTLLNLPNVLVIYEDRQYGGLKCYQVTISKSDSQAVLDKFKYIQHMVKACLAPSKIKDGGYMCSACEYKNTCKEWG